MINTHWSVTCVYDFLLKLSEIKNSLINLNKSRLGWILKPHLRTFISSILLSELIESFLILPSNFYNRHTFYMRKLSFDINQSDIFQVKQGGHRTTNMKFVFFWLRHKFPSFFWGGEFHQVSEHFSKSVHPIDINMIRHVHPTNGRKPSASKKPLDLWEQLPKHHFNLSIIWLCRPPSKYVALAFDDV